MKATFEPTAAEINNALILANQMPLGVYRRLEGTSYVVLTFAAGINIINADKIDREITKNENRVYIAR
jgi:hypothetical protein